MSRTGHMDRGLCLAPSPVHSRRQAVLAADGRAPASRIVTVGAGVEVVRIGEP